MHGPRRSMVHKCQLVSSLAAPSADAGRSRSSRFLNDSCVSSVWSTGETYFCVKQISSFQSGSKSLHWPCPSREEEHQDLKRRLCVFRLVHRRDVLLCKANIEFLVRFKITSLALRFEGRRAPGSESSL